MIGKPVPTLRRKLVVTSFLSVLLPVIVLCAVCYTLLFRHSYRAQQAADLELALHAADNTDRTIASIEAFARNICYAAEIQQPLQQYAGPGPQGEKEAQGERLFALRSDVNRALLNYGNMFPSVNNVVIFSADGTLAGSMGGFDTAADARAYDWYGALAASKGESLWLGECVDPNNYSGRAVRLLPLVKKIRNLGTKWPGFAGEIGYALIYLDRDRFLQSTIAGGREGNRGLLLLDGSGALLGSSAPEDFTGAAPPLPDGQGNLVWAPGGRAYLVSWQALGHNGWRVAALSRYADIARDANMAAAICLLVVGMLLVVFYFFSTRSAKAVVAAVTGLRNAFRAVETGDFRGREFPSSRIQELDELNSRFGLMAQRLEQLIHDVYESRIKEQQLASEVQQTQIESLQMQINPHFIYNTLDSINWMALMGGNEDVSQMAQALGDFLRFNVNMEELYCTVGEEVENTGHFMYIQQVRFEPRLACRFDVPEAVKGYRVIKLLLQPLVENAIRHGVEPVERACTVSVQIRRQEGRLCVRVADDGRGMDCETLAKLGRMWAQVSEGGGGEGKVGLANLMRRLYLCYGGAATFHIESAPDKGTEIRIGIPLQTEEPEQA